MRKAIIVAAFLASLGVSDTKGAASEGSTYNRLACRQACEQIGIWDAEQGRGAGGKKQAGQYLQDWLQSRAEILLVIATLGHAIGDTP